MTATAAPNLLATAALQAQSPLSPTPGKVVPFSFLTEGQGKMNFSAMALRSSFVAF